MLPTKEVENNYGYTGSYKETNCLTEYGEYKSALKESDGGEDKPDAVKCAYDKYMFKSGDDEQDRMRQSAHKGIVADYCENSTTACNIEDESGNPVEPDEMCMNLNVCDQGMTVFEIIPLALEFFKIFQVLLKDISPEEQMKLLGRKNSRVTEFKKKQAQLKLIEMEGIKKKYNDVLKAERDEYINLNKDKIEDLESKIYPDKTNDSNGNGNDSANNIAQGLSNVSGNIENAIEGAIQNVPNNSSSTGNNKNNTSQSIAENSKQASGSGNGDVPSANAGQSAGGNQQTVENIDNNSGQPTSSTKKKKENGNNDNNDNNAGNPIMDENWKKYNFETAFQAYKDYKLFNKICGSSDLIKKLVRDYEKKMTTDLTKDEQEIYKDTNQLFKILEEYEKQEAQLKELQTSGTLSKLTKGLKNASNQALEEDRIRKKCKGIALKGDIGDMLGAAGNVITSPVNKIAKIAKTGSDNKKNNSSTGASNISGEATPYNQNSGINKQNNTIPNNKPQVAGGIKEKRKTCKKCKLLNRKISKRKKMIN